MLSSIFKKSFIEGYASADIGVSSLLMAVGITTVIAMYIFFMYRVLTRKTFYSKNFNLSLVGVSVITAAIIVTIQSSVVVSLGMVGALSIVRFRTAIKDPIDLMFLFWSISVGIICGAGFAEFAIIMSLAITIIIFLLERVPLVKMPMILVINANDSNIEDSIMETVKQYASTSKIKSRNVTTSTFDLIIELRTKSDEELFNAVKGIEGVTSVSLLSHDGEATY